jgi:putative SOS response-associated peptidase YedK
MCGRYVNVASTDDLTDEFDVGETVGEQLPPSWNIAPTDPVRAVVQRAPHHADKHESDKSASTSGTVRQLRTVRWGLVPSWSKDRKGAARLINARIETVTDKPAFKTAAARRRCLLPALGYYEWQNGPDGKQPFFLHEPDGSPLAMAGLYELWPDPELAEDDPQRWLWTATIITQPATDLMGEIHDRTPVAVPPELRAAWLDCSSGDAQTARDLLDQIPTLHLAPDPVTKAVGNIRNNGPELIEPVPAPSEADESGTPAVQELF